MCETVIGIVMCYSHQGCYVLYYLCEISSNIGIHIYLTSCNCGFGFEEKYWRIEGFGERKGTDRRICIPLLSPPLKLEFFPCRINDNSE